MKLVDDFFNKAAKAIDSKYFPDVKYYRDDKRTTKIHYSLELYSNGCLTYDKLIKDLSKACNETEENIHAIVSPFILDFEDYQGKFSK